MDYTINPNDPNVSTTFNKENDKWSISNLYDTPFTVNSLIETLQVIDIFKKKYPTDEVITDFEDIVRDEICQIFGGTTITE